jgi:hypothetical protein
MTKMIELRDVGPITRLQIPIPESGLVIVRGANGSGKTRALEAVGALVGSGVRPATRDGAAGAFVEGMGCRLTVGRRSTVDGELEVTALDGEDPSLLVEPNIKSPDAADAARIKALLRLSNAKIDATSFAGLVGGDVRLRELCRETSLEAKDVTEMAAAIKRDVEQCARKCEGESANLLSKAAGIRSTLKDLHGGKLVEVKHGSADEAREAHSEAIRQQASIKTTREQQVKLQAAGRAAQAALESMGDGGTDGALAASSARLATASASTQSACSAVEGAKEALARARQAVADAVAAHELELEREAAAAAAWNRQQQQADQRKQLGNAIAQSESVGDFDDAALASANDAVVTTRNEMDAWVIRERTENQRKEAERLEHQGQAASKEAAELRTAARGTEGIVLDAVRAVAPAGMELSEGRLYIQTDRGRELFSDLSHGERWRIALDISVKAVGRGGLLVCRQEAFESLDPANRRAIAEYAREVGVVILTAVADEGELRAEVA